jgi:membrane protein
VRSTWLVLDESVRSFFSNDGLTASSSLAFFSTIAMIPALFLLTYLNTFSESISQYLTLKTNTLLEELVPQGSAEVLNQIISISSPTSAVGLINLVILLWSITPLISALRRTFHTIFKFKRKRLYFMEKFFDLLLVTVFIFVYATVATSGVLLSLLPDILIPLHLETFLPYLVLFSIVLASYFAFSPKTKLKYLVLGAAASTTLWFIFRPAFNIFLTYNVGFGFMFGSLKSIFVVVIWVYISQCIYLFGAEIAASLRRRQAVVIKRLMDGKKPGHIRTVATLLDTYKAGEVVFTKGQNRPEMYFIRYGSVQIEKDGKPIANIAEGRFFGEMSFLLSEKRSATVRALTDIELIIISHENFEVLIREFPHIVENMLSEMAHRLRKTTDLII